MRTRLFSMLVMITLLLSWTGVTVAHAALHLPDSAPEDTTQELVGFDAPTFHARQYAFLTSQGVEELSTLNGTSWADHNITSAAGAPLPGTNTLASLAGLFDAHLNEKQYAYFGTNGDLIELFVHPSGAWSFEDLYASAGIGGKGGDGLGLTGYASALSGIDSFFWTEENGDVLDLYSTDGTHWTFSNLGASSNDSNSELGTSQLGFTAFDAPEFGSTQEQFAFTDGDPSTVGYGDVIEADSLDGKNWFPSDLTALAHAPAGIGDVAGGGATVGFASSQFNSKQYAYLTSGSDGADIEELYVFPHGSWQAADLSARTGAPLADIDTPLAGFDSPQFHAKQYAYITEDDSQGVRDIEELSITSGGSWQAASPDLSAQTGAPPAFGTTLVGFDSPTFSTKQYAYLTQQGDVEELSRSVSGTWQAKDLTLAALP